MDIYVLLYSQTQDCFSVEETAHMLEKNLNAFLKHREVDYVPIAFSNSREKLSDVKKELLLNRPEALPEPRKIS